MSTEFKQEEGYIVFKLGDLHRYCPDFNISSIERVWQIIAEGRALEGKRPFSAVVIENDLPENEPIWKAIEARVTGAQPAQKAVAYLDLGAGGYMDIGTDLNDEQLASLPKGRHMLGIVGTYGVDGYVSAQPAPSINPAALSPVINWLRNGCDPMKAADELEMLAAAPEAKPCP